MIKPLHVYIAGPYRAPTAWMRECQIREAERAGFNVATMGAVPVIPHTMFRFFDGTLVDGYWLDATLSLLDRCDAVLLVGDWERSEGTLGEIQAAKKKRKPVFELAYDLERWLGECATKGAK